MGTYRRKLTELSKLGVEVTAVIPPGWREGGRLQPVEGGSDRAYRLIVTPLRLNGHFHLHYYPRLPAIIRETSPDLIHVDEEPYNLATYLAVRAAAAGSIPSLFFTWQNISKRYPPPFSWMERSVYRSAAAAIAGNAEAAQILRARGFSAPLAVIPQFGVDTDQFSPSRTPHAGFRIGLLNRLIPAKGTQVMLDALALLPGDVELSIVGDGPDRAALERTIAARHWEERVRIRSRVPSSEVPALMNSLDAVVLPSLTTPEWKEQFGRVLIEAMASGVPVIGSDSGEIPHVVADAGLIVPENDVSALAAAVSRLYHDPSLRASLAESGRRRATSTYSHAAIARATLTLYNQALARPERSSP